MLPGDWDRYDQAIRDKCEADGLEETRLKLAAGRYGERKGPIVREWIAGKEAALAAADKEVDRDIAREANRIAKRAWWTPIGAALVAAAALVVAGYAALREFPLSHSALLGAAPLPAAPSATPVSPAKR